MFLVSVVVESLYHIMHKLSNFLFFRLINANKIECIKPDTFSGLASLNLLWVLLLENTFLFQLFSDENFWSFPRKIGFLKCELSYLLFMLYLQSGSNVHWKYKPRDMIWYLGDKKLYFHCNVVSAQPRVNIMRFELFIVFQVALWQQHPNSTKWHFLRHDFSANTVSIKYF